MEQDLTESPVPELDAPVEILTPEEYVATLVKRAKGAAGRLSSLPTAVKNQALEAMADGLEEHETERLAENEKDLEDIPADVRAQLAFVWMEQIDDAIRSALAPAATAPARA